MDSKKTGGASVRENGKSIIVQRKRAGAETEENRKATSRKHRQRETWTRTRPAQNTEYIS